MALSVNTNRGVMVALQNLTTTNKALERTQLNTTTGLRVNGPKDDASTYAIAQNMRGDIAGLGAVRTALSNAEATVNVALTAAEEVSDLLLEMKAKAVQGNQAGIDATSRTALTNDFLALRDQIDEVVRSAEFNGVNLVENGAADLEVLTRVDGSTFTVSATPIQAITLQFGLPGADLYTSANAQTSLAIVETAIVTVSEALSTLGSAAKRIDIQNDFTGKLMDIFKAGIGNLVDADLAQEAAELQALQTKQQLGVQALGIANSSPQTILSLFNG